MIKRILSNPAERPNEERWLALEELADVDVTSEEATSPVERAFAGDASAGWRAALPGRQTIRLHFHRPLRLTRIQLTFDETARPRTHEFVVTWQAHGAERDTEVVRQQFTFAPPGTTREQEDYTVDLQQVAALELSILPDISGSDARAALTHLRLA